MTADQLRVVLRCGNCPDVPIRDFVNAAYNLCPRCGQRRRVVVIEEPA